MGGIDGRGQAFVGQADAALCPVFIAIHKQHKKACQAGGGITHTLCLRVKAHKPQDVAHVEHEIPAEGRIQAAHPVELRCGNWHGST